MEGRDVAFISKTLFQFWTEFRKSSQRSLQAAGTPARYCWQYRRGRQNTDYKTEIWVGWKQFRNSKSVTKKKKRTKLPKLFQNAQLLQSALPGSPFLPVYPSSNFSPALPIYPTMSEQRGMQDFL